MNLGIGTWPARRAAVRPLDVCIEFESAATTYADFATRVNRLANALTDAGVRHGDRVAVVSFNHPAVLETFFASGLIGAICVLVNPRLRTPEIEYILRDSAPSVVVHGGQLVGVAAELAPRLEVREWLSVDEPGVGRPFEEFLRSGAPEMPMVDVQQDDVALIMYTSGTTGNPKGAMLTHGNLFYQYVNALIGQDLRQDEVHLAVAPLFHIAGLNMMTLPTFTLGGRIIIHRGFQAEAVLAEIARSRVTSTFMVPSMLDLLSQSPEFAASDLSSLRAVMVGGSPLPERTIRTYLARNIPTMQGFGMTEASPGITMLEPRDSLDKLGSAGRVHFFAEYRLVDLNGDDVEPGETGEILARGPAVMKGYWSNPSATERALEGGWYHSGDIGSCDEDGYLYIRDRLKDMYISGGENVYPAEIENALLNLPGVRDAAVIGVPDEKWGETGRAFVVPTPDAPGVDEIRAQLKTRIAGYKMPRDIVIIDELPRTATGKVRKHDLRTLTV